MSVTMFSDCVCVTLTPLLNFELQAFGVGALEDDDDEEVYQRDSMSRYDTVLGGEEPGDGLYGWTAPQQYTKKRGDAAACRPEKSLKVWGSQKAHTRSLTKSRILF